MSTDPPASRASAVTSDGYLKSYPAFEEQLPLERVLLASIFVEDAFHGRKHQVKTDVYSMRKYQTYYSPIVQHIIHVAVVLHLSLAFFEQPATLLDLPSWFLGLLELCFLVIYAWDMMYKRTFIDSKRYSNWRSDKNMWANWVCVTLTIIDMVIYVIMDYGFPDVYYFRWSRFLRVYFVIYFFQSARHYYKNLKQAIPDILHVFAVLFGIMFFYVLIFLVVLGDSGDEQFKNTFNTFITLYILSTTANFPDTLVYAYNRSPLYALLFVSYCVIITKVMLSLFTAVVYNRYGFYITDDVAKSVKLRRAKLAAAFALLDIHKRGRLTYSDWTQLFKELRPEYQPDKVRLMFHIIDETASGDVDKREFLKIVSLLHLHIRSQRSDDKAENWFASLVPAFYTSRFFPYLKTFVTSKFFGWAMDGVVVLNALQVIIYQEIPSIPQAVREAWEWLLFLFYFIEMLLKLIVHGPGPYWSDNWNKFDVVSVFSSFISLLVVSGLGLQSRGFVRFVLLMRSLRLFRFMLLGRASPTIRSFYSTLGRLIPTLLQHGLAILIAFYAFALLGMQIWGGKASPESPALASSAYATIQSFYGTNPNPGLWGTSNFNTFGNALLTLFELMIQNNWHVVSDAFARVTSNWAWIYFISFNISTAVVFLNILLAFILDGFINEWKSVQNPTKTKVQIRIEELARQQAQLTDAAKDDITNTAGPMIWTAADESYKIEPMSFNVEVDVGEAVEELDAEVSLDQINAGRVRQSIDQYRASAPEKESIVVDPVDPAASAEPPPRKRTPTKPEDEEDPIVKSKSEEKEDPPAPAPQNPPAQAAQAPPPFDPAAYAYYAQQGYDPATIAQYYGQYYAQQQQQPK